MACSPLAVFSGLWIDATGLIMQRDIALLQFFGTFTIMIRKGCSSVKKMVIL
jgi:hypothetical protein